LRVKIVGPDGKTFGISKEKAKKLNCPGVYALVINGEKRKALRFGKSQKSVLRRTREHVIETLGWGQNLHNPDCLENPSYSCSKNNYSHIEGIFKNAGGQNSDKPMDYLKKCDIYISNFEEEDYTQYIGSLERRLIIAGQRLSKDQKNENLKFIRLDLRGTRSHNDWESFEFVVSSELTSLTTRLRTIQSIQGNAVLGTELEDRN
jgi:hypothetical protein